MNVQQQVLAQARNLRSEASGVSLNDQAAQMLQFQEGIRSCVENGHGTGSTDPGHHQYAADAITKVTIL